MRRSETRSRHMKTETGLCGEEFKFPGQLHKHITAPGANFRNDAGSCVDYGPQVSNLVWSYHLITTLRAHGLVISILTIIDEYTQECLLSRAAEQISTENVIDDLFGLFLKRGIPKYLFAFSENDAMPNAICEWLEKLEVNSTFVELKKYGDNGYGALFKDKLLRDFLHEKSFASLVEVQLWLTNWREEHNRSKNFLRMQAVGI